MESFDDIVVGAGMAGASAAYALAREGRRVVLLEREDQPGYHSTGRSAAVYTQTYGNAVIRGLTVGGWRFFSEPPSGFADDPLTLPRGALVVGRQDQEDDIDRAFDEARRLTASVRRLDAAAVRDKVPLLRDGFAVGGVFEPEARDIDVHGLHQGFLKAFRACGGLVSCSAEVLGLDGGNDGWRVETKAGTYRAPVLINAAGAWADELAVLASGKPVGLVPKRRTAIIFDPPPGMAVAGWPLVIGVAEDFYFKPDAGKLLGSPADETPSPPCDARPEELDIAITVDRLQQAADIEIKRIEHSWAGLRSFVADKTPVVGFDPDLEGFFWLAGQGGYGIQTSPSLSRVTAGLVTGKEIPTDLQELGVSESALSPRRLF